jgi:hypothetical protein
MICKLIVQIEDDMCWCDEDQENDEDQEDEEDGRSSAAFLLHTGRLLIIGRDTHDGLGPNQSIICDHGERASMSEKNSTLTQKSPMSDVLIGFNTHFGQRLINCSIVPA